MARARAEIQRHPRRAISVIVWAEVLVGTRNPEEEGAIREFLAGFELLPLDRETVEEAVKLRRAHHLRLPDALVWATARVKGALLVTRNTKDFPADDPGVRVPYKV